MRTKYLIALIVAIGFLANSCTKQRGCTEATADNYSAGAEEDDGTCIPSRDKLIGNYRYTKLWTDAIVGGDSVDIGTMVATEAGGGINQFNFFLDGNLLLQGSISQNAITMENHTYEETYFGIPWTRTYSGNGNWLESDTVDFQMTLATQIPTIDQNNGQLSSTPQVFNYYFTQQE